VDAVRCSTAVMLGLVSARGAEMIGGGCLVYETKVENAGLVGISVGDAILVSTLVCPLPKTQNKCHIYVAAVAAANKRIGRVPK